MNLNAPYSCHKRAQALIISLWVLVILTILAVSIGHRVSLGLYLSRYQKDKLKAAYLAKAGVTRGIAQLEEDTNDYDALNENWADNEELFKTISLGDNPNEFARVSYTVIEDSQAKTVFGVMDEEAKININAASAELLTALFQDCQAPNVADIVNNIRAWRGDTDPLIPKDAKDYDALGYACKESKFTNIAELMLVKDITGDLYNSLKKFITAYSLDGDGKININTASKEILKILGLTAVSALGDSTVGEADVNALIGEIILFRASNGYFTTEDMDTDKIRVKLNLGDILSDARTKIVNQLVESGMLNAVSENFSIEVSGNVGKIRHKTTAVYNRQDNKILYWHES